MSTSWGSYRGRLLRTLRTRGTELTDEQMAIAAQVPMRSCFWKRCGELREAGLIEWVRDPETGQRRTARSTLGGDQGLNRITDAGKAHLARTQPSDWHWPV